MDEEVLALLRKARKTLEAGKIMLSHGFPEDAASEAYYAMYYAARALLLRRAKKLKQHKEVRKKFNELLIASGQLENKFEHYLEKGLRMRHFADYETDLTITISSEDAQVRLREAREFVEAAQQFLKGVGGDRED